MSAGSPFSLPQTTADISFEERSQSLSTIAVDVARISTNANVSSRKRSYGPPQKSTTESHLLQRKTPQTIADLGRSSWTQETNERMKMIQDNIRTVITRTSGLHENLRTTREPDSSSLHHSANARSLWETTHPPISTLLLV